MFFMDAGCSLAAKIYFGHGTIGASLASAAHQVLSAGFLPESGFLFFPVKLQAYAPDCQYRQQGQERHRTKSN